MICTVINNTVPTNEKVRVKYRSYNNLDVDALNTDLSSVTVSHPELINERSKSTTHSLYNKFETQVSNIFDKHIPEQKTKQFPCMNKKLQKAIYNKKMTRNKFNEHWEAYSKNVTLSTN